MERFLDKMRKIDPVWVLCLLAVAGLAVMFVTRYIMVRDSRGNAAAIELLTPPGTSGAAQGSEPAANPNATANPSSATPRPPSPSPTPAPTIDPAQTILIIHSANSRVFHIDPGCHSVRGMNEANRREIEASVNDMLENGFRPCGNCARGVGD